MAKKVSVPTTSGGGNALPIGWFDPDNIQNVTYTTATQTTNPVAPDTGVVQFYLPEAAYVLFGTNPTATVSNAHIYPAGANYAYVATDSKASILQTGSGGIASFMQVK